MSDKNQDLAVDLLNKAHAKMAEAMSFVSQAMLFVNHQTEVKKRPSRAPRSRIGEIKKHLHRSCKIKYVSSKRDEKNRFKIYSFEAICPGCQKGTKFESGINIYRVIESEKEGPQACENCGESFLE